jgi:uncharacterized protein (TIGR02118 family)
MTCAYFIYYRIRANDPAAFIQYYREQHMPLVRQFPGIRSADLHIGVDDASPFLIVVRLVFDSQEDLGAALRSPERELARADMQRFPAFEGEILRQVTLIESTFAP